MSWEELVILLPCQSLEDLRLDRDATEAEELLAGWSGLYHPAVVSFAGKLPRWQKASDPPQDPANRLIVVPGCCEPLLPPEWMSIAEASGGLVLRDYKDRAHLLAALLPRVDTAERNIDPDLVADFLALGFCHFQVELLTRQLRYMSNLDEPRFRTETLAAADKAVGGDAAQAREHLRAAFELLTQSREYFYPVETHLLDLTLVASSTLGASLRAELAGPGPTNLLLSARTLEEMAAREPATLEALKAALAAGTATIVGGEYEEVELPLLDVESILARLRRGLDTYQRHLGLRPTLFGRRRFGLSPVLPQILLGLGFEGALHFTLDDGRFPAANQSKIRWEGTDSAAIESLARVPMDATRPESFLRLAEQLGRTMDLDHAATGVFARWPGQTCSWYGDLRRMLGYSPVLGRLLGIGDYFRRTMYVGQTTRYKADEYRSPYLQQAVAAGERDPISRWVRFHTRRAAADAAAALAAMADLAASRVEGEASAEAILADLDKSLDGPFGDGKEAREDPASGPSLDERLGEELSHAMLRFARAMPRNEGPAEKGCWVVNPAGYVRRMYVDVSALARPPQPGGAVKAMGPWSGGTLAAVEVPAMGFAWIAPPAEEAAPQPTWRAHKKKKKEEVPLVEEHVLHNEFFEVHVSPATGGIQGIYGFPKRGNRMAQQIALRWPQARRGEDDLAEDDPEQEYTVMKADEVRVTESGPMVGQMLSRGRLVDRDGKPAAGFRQTTTVRRGSRVIELAIELDVDRQPGTNAWASYYAARFAWGNELAELRRGVSLTSRPTEATRVEAPHFIEVRSDKECTTLLTGGLTYHRRLGLRKLDTLLVVRGETARSFRLGIGLDLPYPIPAALDFLAPKPVLVEAAPPPSAPCGWLFHVDSRNVVATHWAPLASEGRVTGFRVRLLETEGRACQATVTALRPLAAARRVDLRGESPSDLATQDDHFTVDMNSHQWVQVEADFAR